jgi:hypothetical protein
VSDPWTAAWEESEATAPPGVLTYCTLELQHTSFEVPVRVVTGVDTDQSFTIEEDADFNGGTSQTFTAVPFYAERPEFAEGKTPTCLVTVDNVGRELAPKLEAAVLVKADLAVLYREYRSDDLTEPCYGPVRFVMKRVSVKGTSVVGTAQLDDLANRKFPYKVASVKEFPGLVA